MARLEPLSGYMFVMLTVLLPLVLGSNTQDICNRDPPDTTASRTPGDNGFRIKMVGRPQPERYTPEQVYTVVINGTYPNQKLLGFMLVAVPLHARDESTAMGNFQHMSNGATQFAEDCPHVVTHTYPHAKAGVEVLWTAPPAGTGCIEFRATVIEYTDIWYKDDGALTRVFCEETGTTENNQSPEMLPECCACGTAKYQMTFHGTWSRRTHPKDYPTQKRLLHWSNIVGASHSKHYMIWQYGAYSSQGIRQVCEFGYTRMLEQEMREHSRDVRTVIKTPGIWWSDPHGLEQTRWARFSVDKKNHLVSMLSMLGPSPDWCVGISAVNLCLPNCSWTGDMEMDLYPWDAGTDDGITYMAPNKKSDPQQKVHRITNTFPNSPESPFYGLDPIAPLGTIKLRRIHPKEGDPQVCTDRLDHDISDNDIGIEESEDLEKKMVINEGKCAIADWLDWSECSVTCGVGQRFRKRMYIDPTMDEASCGLPVMESENCIGIENECETLADDCAVSRWSDWSPCSVTCGKGTKDRRRYYLRPEDEEICDRQLQEVDICMSDVLDCSKAVSMLNFTAICSQPLDYGKCRADFQFERYYFDTTMRKCLPFTYSGCRGNDNNFQSEQRCMEMCFNVMKEAMTKQLADEEERKRKMLEGQNPDGFEVEDSQHQEDDPTALCSLPSDTGPCRASQTRYYFDVDMGKCLQFTFGGCQGNGNKFLTEEACMDLCFMPMKEKMMRLATKKEAEETEDRKNKKANNKNQNSEDTGKPKKKKKNKGQKKNKDEKDKKEIDPDNPKIDCMTTDWSDWSSCSTTCGRGFKYKHRVVKQEPQNGGKKCPKRLEKKKRCKMPKCKKDESQSTGLTHVESHHLGKRNGDSQSQSHKTIDKNNDLSTTKLTKEEKQKIRMNEKAKKLRRKKKRRRKNKKSEKAEDDQVVSASEQKIANETGHNLKKRPDEEEGSKNVDREKGSNDRNEERKLKKKRKMKWAAPPTPPPTPPPSLPASIRDWARSQEKRDRNRTAENIQPDGVSRRKNKKSKNDKIENNSTAITDVVGNMQNQSLKNDNSSRGISSNTRNETSEKFEADKSVNNTSTGEDSKTDKEDENKTDRESNKGNNIKSNRKSRRKNKKKPKVEKIEDSLEISTQTPEEAKTKRKKDKKKSDKKGKQPKNNSIDTITEQPDLGKDKGHDLVKVRDCGVTQWSEWSMCSVTCGRGFMFKRRIVEEDPKNGGMPCPTKLERKRKCNMHSCPHERCKMGDWSEWTQCPKTCGSGSIQERTRELISAPDGNTSVCGPSIERRYCTLPPCPNQDDRRVRTYYRSP